MRIWCLFSLLRNFYRPLIWVWKLRNFSHTLFWQKFCESNVFTSKVKKRLISRIFFLGESFSFFHTVILLPWGQLLSWMTVRRRPWHWNHAWPRPPYLPYFFLTPTSRNKKLVFVLLIYNFFFSICPQKWTDVFQQPLSISIGRDIWK